MVKLRSVISAFNLLKQRRHLDFFNVGETALVVWD